MKRVLLPLASALLIGVSSCVLEPPEAPIAPPACGFVCNNTYPLTASQKNDLEGIYLVEIGTDKFGQTVVVKWNTPNYLTIFTGQDVTYLVLQAGYIDSVFFFEGYWRSQNSHRSGRASFVVTKQAGGRRLMGDSLSAESVVFEGTVGEGGGDPSKVVVLRRAWSIRPEVRQKRFWILAHRGGGRMSELPPHSENTVELIRMAEQFGANGVEIDVRLTKDNVPILYHDNTLNPRLVRKTPMLGSVEDYSLPQLRTCIRLLNGEQIPTLDEVLRSVVYETGLNLVWLDMKTEQRHLVERVLPLVQQYQAEANALVSQQLRDSLEIMMGVPSDNIMRELLDLPSYTTVPTIAEKSIEKARRLNSRVWAPLWSAGIDLSDNTTAHAEGRRSIVWTLDEPQFVREFVQGDQYDGILSDYPMLVAYHFYVR